MTIDDYNSALFTHTIDLLEDLCSGMLLSRNIIRDLAKNLKKAVDIENIELVRYEDLLSKYVSFTKSVRLPQDQFYK